MITMATLDAVHPLAAMMLWQLGGRSDSGLLVLFAIALLLLAGGIFLLVRGFWDFLQTRRAARRDHDVGRKKAA
jgi:uncharacterized membrane protein YidH (DUF202 family)